MHSNKVSISEEKACEYFLEDLNDSTDVALEKLNQMFPDYFKGMNVEKDRKMIFYTLIYCGMLRLRESFSSKQSESIRNYVSKVSAAEDFHLLQKELLRAQETWDEEMYKPSPEHPLENVARYLYLKIGMPLQRVKFGNRILDRPNLAVVYVIESVLILATTIWIEINKRFDITPIHETN